MDIMNNLKNCLSDFIESRPAYKDYEQYKKEIDFYRNNIQPMTDEQGNQFRHYTTAALMSRDYKPFIPNFAGISKEIVDIINHKNKGLTLKEAINDSLFDMGNNFNGSIRGGFLDKKMPRREVYDTLFRELYGSNDNGNKNKMTLYGYITNTDE